MVIGEGVEVGSLATVCRGSTGDTILQDRVKTDDYVHIGHDAVVREDTKIAAGVTLGGYCSIGNRVFIGVNACFQNRVVGEEDALVGMGSVVTKRVRKETTVFGSPAKAIF